MECRDSTKRACTILLLAKKIKFFYSFFHNHLQILHPKKIPDFRIKHASLCFIGEAQGRGQQAHSNESIKPRLEHLKIEYYLIFSAEF